MGRRRVWSAVTGCLVATLLVPTVRPADGQVVGAVDPPALDAAPCPDGAPDDAECGVLVVPERRGDDGGRTVRLPYMALPADDPDPDALPLVYMSGGRGSEMVQLAGWLGYLLLA